MADSKYLDRIQWGRLLTEAWSNASFLDSLEKDPTTTIKDYAKQHFGIELERPFQLPPVPANLVVEHLSGSNLLSTTGNQDATAGGEGSGTLAATGSFTASGGSSQGSASGCATGGGPEQT